VYPVMPSGPVCGGDQLTVASLGPAFARTVVGAPGTLSRGSNDAEGADAGETPTAFVAVTETR
jgi:hypothetical protein